MLLSFAASSDANANRAREAMRVMEEAARFLLDDVELTAATAPLRHDLATAALEPVTALEANRDTPGDVGTTIKAQGEMSRDSAGDVAIAAGKRLSEALRAIEEYATRTLPEGQRELAGRAEALRYRGYELEQRLGRAMGSVHGPAMAVMCAADRRALPEPKLAGRGQSGVGGGGGLPATARKIAGWR